MIVIWIRKPSFSFTERITDEMKRVLCLVLFLVMAFSFTACGANTDARAEEKNDSGIGSWKPVPVYSDFGEETGYSATTFEYETRCVLVNDDSRSSSYPIIFRYQNAPDAQRFFIYLEELQNKTMNRLWYIIDGDTSNIFEISKYNGVLGKQGTRIASNVYPEHFTRILDALMEGKDVTI